MTESVKFYKKIHRFQGVTPVNGVLELRGQRADLGTELIDCTAVVNSFKVEYKGGDHHVRVLGVNAKVQKIRGSEVEYDVRLELRDDSRNYPVEVGSYVTMLLIARCPSA